MDKQQRIKLSIYKHPVKLDGMIREMSPDGKWLIVEFDGPLPDKKLYWNSENTLSDFDPQQPAPKGGLLYTVR